MKRIILSLVLIVATSVINAASVSGQGTWETTLQGRDLDGNAATFEAYYDTILNITWLADTNAGAGSAFDDGFSATDGQMSWANANAWAASFDPYGSGITGWRLPSVTDVGNDGATYTNIYQGVDYGYNIDTANGEMAHMFYETLGNKARYDTSGNPTGCTFPDACLSNRGPFSNLSTLSYWSATEYAPTGSAWIFYTDNGFQSYVSKASYLTYAWAVHSGDIGAVPIPAAVWLFGSGLIGFIGIAKRKMRVQSISKPAHLMHGFN